MLSRDGNKPTSGAGAQAGGSTRCVGTREWNCGYTRLFQTDSNPCGRGAAVIYLVEMDFRNPAREHDWHVWYLEHSAFLVRTMPGFTATQRFRCLNASPSPWLALHEVSGPEVFESAQYKAGGGPPSTGEWAREHINWQRNLFDGTRQTPDVAFDQHLLMAEGDAALPDGYEAGATRLVAVGLDRSSRRRSIAVVPAGGLKAGMLAMPGVRVLKPITPRIAR